jgi:hypothetical protein
MHHQPRRFVEHGQIGIFKHHVEWQVFGCEGGVFRQCGHGDAQGFAGAGLVAHASHLSAHAHQPRFAPLLQAAAGILRKLRGKYFVEPLPGVGLGDDGFEHRRIDSGAVFVEIGEIAVDRRGRSMWREIGHEGEARLPIICKLYTTLGD